MSATSDRSEPRRLVDKEQAHSDLTEALHESARWRLASVLLGPPGPDLADEIERLGDLIGGPVRGLATEVAALARQDADLAAAYHRLLGPGGACPPAESDYDSAASCNKGPLIADVMAFYHAFGFDPASEWRECPDHAAVECAFLSYLHFKYAQALFAGLSGPADVTRKAIADFWTDHLGGVWPGLLERLEEAARWHPFYERACNLVRGLAR